MGKISGVSRSVARRLHSRAHREAWLSDAVSSINALGPCPPWGPRGQEMPAEKGASGPPLTGLLADRVESRVSSLQHEISRVGPPPSSLTPAGALQELCSVSPGYADVHEDATGALARYDKDLVSWPEVAGPRRPLGPLVLPSDRPFVDRPELLLRPAPERDALLQQAGLLRP